MFSTFTLITLGNNEGYRNLNCILRWQSTLKYFAIYFLLILKIHHFPHPTLIFLDKCNLSFAKYFYGIGLHLVPRKTSTLPEWSWTVTMPSSLMTRIMIKYIFIKNLVSPFSFDRGSRYQHAFETPKTSAWRSRASRIWWICKVYGTFNEYSCSSLGSFKLLQYSSKNNCYFARNL